MRNRVRQITVLLAVGCLAAIMGGCGKSGLERVVHSGKVTYRGEPIKSGEIRFIPTKGTEAPFWSARIVEGQYLANGRGGVPIGTYRVEIVGWRQKGTSKSLPIGVSPGDLPKDQYLPAKFNTKSDLEITVIPGSEKVVKDFILTD